jgi:pimeloyl-ACP methyl ester carboxylesterase
MQRKYSRLEYKKAQIHYSEFGKGDKALICFHGFGQSSAHFHKLEDALKEEYKIYSFDLFYHGKSFWHDKDTPLSKKFWNELIQKFILEKNIDRFSLLGFSMGGKFVMATLEKFSDKIDKIILIAPDGIKTSFWYSLATYPGSMTKLFRSVITKPNFYFNLVKFLSFFKIVDKGLLRFANTQMATRVQRRRVYYSWVVFKELKFDMKKIAFILNKNNIKLELFLGEFDKVITQKNMKKLLDKVNDYRINVLSSGHSTLIDAVAKYYNSRQTTVGNDNW